MVPGHQTAGLGRTHLFPRTVAKLLHAHADAHVTEKVPLGYRPKGRGVLAGGELEVTKVDVGRKVSGARLVENVDLGVVSKRLIGGHNIP